MKLEGSITQNLKRHWPEYLMEAGCLGSFMISACFFSVLLWHPDSPVRQAIPNEFVRMILAGIAMGLTAISIIHSPWGKRSGAHMNPAITWTFFRLGKMEAWDAVFYSLAQFMGGVAGVVLSASFIRLYLEHPAVHYAVTRPGDAGVAVALLAESVISFLMMFTVLSVSNHPRLSRYTPLFAGTLVALFITFESPLSGMSMNPARTVGSALPAADWTALWIYFLAPLFGMLIAAETYTRTRGLHRVFCAKLNHYNNQRCIFRCNFGKLMQTEQQPIQAI